MGMSKTGRGTVRVMAKIMAKIMVKIIVKTMVKIMVKVIARITFKTTGKIKSEKVDRTTGMITAKTTVKIRCSLVTLNDIDMLLVTVTAAKGVTTVARPMVTLETTMDAETVEVALLRAETCRRGFSGNVQLLAGLTTKQPVKPPKVNTTAAAIQESKTTLQDVKTRDATIPSVTTRLEMNTPGRTHNIPTETA